MKLTEEQEAAMNSALAFLKAPRKPYFNLKGLAGTGKTTVLGVAARRIPNVTTVAPTAKAAAVLRAKTGLTVRTIHSAIYDFKGLVEDEEEFGRMRPTFADKAAPGLDGRPVLLDESSMVGEKLATDLLKCGAIIVACGDPGQLPPVRDRQFFCDADVTLTQIHRQAAESPIIRQAYAVRSTGAYTTDGDGFVVVDNAEMLDLTRYEIILCWKNATRRTFNVRARKARGIHGPVLRPGEPIMCLKNDYAANVFNGEVYTVGAAREPGKLLSFEDGKDIYGARVEGIDPDYEEALKDNDKIPFALAYSATTHKAQGSEWKSVLVHDEMPQSNPDYRRLMYTAFTRASEHATIVRH